MNVSFSLFFYCRATEGGAIYFDSEISVLKMICSSNCSATNYLFAFIKGSLINNLEYLTIRSCSSTMQGFYTLYVSSKGNVDNSNISMNYASRVAGIFFNANSFSSSHCTISNNLVHEYNCLYVFSCTGIIKFANIVGNNSPNEGVVHVNGGSLTMNYCIFCNNQNILLFIKSGSLTLSHCYISHIGLFSSKTSVSKSNNNTFTLKETYDLRHFDSHYCFAENPIISKLPYRTYNDNCTCKNVLMGEIMIVFSWLCIISLSDN